MLSKTPLFLLLLPTRAFVHPPVGRLRNRELATVLPNRLTQQNRARWCAVVRTFASSMKRKGTDTTDAKSKARKKLANDSSPSSNKIIHGDLLQLAQTGKFDVIVHGCNCFGAMGAGIAKQIKDQFPEAYEVDKQTYKGDRTKLGTYSSATVDVVLPRSDDDDDDDKQTKPHSVTIVNAYTQHHWSGSGVLADYDAIHNVFVQIKADFSGKRIGYPKIGAGLAGGDWDRISSIINAELEGENHTLVIYQP